MFKKYFYGNRKVFFPWAEDSFCANLALLDLNIACVTLQPGVNNQCGPYFLKNQINHISKMLLAFTWPTHLGGFDFITGAAGPTSKIWENFTLLAIQTWVHLAPPLLQHDGSWKTDGENEILNYFQHYYLQSILVNITFLKFSSKVTILKPVKSKHFRCRFDLQWQAKQLRWLIQIISLPNLETWREIREKSRCFSQIDNCGSTGWINKLSTPNKKIIVWKKSCCYQLDLSYRRKWCSIIHSE